MKRRTSAIRNEIEAKRTRWAIFGFVVLSIYAAVTAPALLEKNIFAFIYNLPGWLTIFFYIFSLLGSAWMFLIVSAVVWFTEKRSYALDILAAGVVTYSAVQIMKWLVDRPRPFELLGDIVHREVFVTGLGFPSGHTAIATSLGLIIMPHLPGKYRLLVPIWIIGTGLSRIFLGVHLPLDVIGGFLLGYVVAKSIKYLREAAKKHKLKAEV